MPANDSLILAAQQLADKIDSLTFAEPVTHVYNPLQYAWQAHQQYLEMAKPRTCKVLFLGMNPGPWGMAQTGVPFGQIEAVRDWIKIDAPIGKPEHEHPKRLVEGLACRRSEVSGERLWGLMRERFKTPKNFFKNHFVSNYCPLVFMEETGRNRTPDKLLPEERKQLAEICDEHLVAVLTALKPQWAVGVGAYAEKCLQRVGAELPVQITRILHPSPASPAANRGWADQATQQLSESGIWT
ncbi:Uracil DNA glycosylase superfamily protein [Roseimaritima multifibrata]|uniref:Uracil DNA glycosylase superfamily protein n=1 Tax=Roseimaritima multifibrata TaxID=1930274 RepID=A0A517ME80_9BACT|nr:uracil-DNA glycosylase family protein [Roseimaritima multifibrata]QDS93192.1 Uracil DNA glycosylase superfamily protein [Roseimaritima multifibrata]